MNFDFNIQFSTIMWSKEEAKEVRIKFWNEFKRYCSKHKIYRRWILTGVKIKSTQLKFHADDKKALVLFQIDHKNYLRRYEIYECFQTYRKLLSAACGDDLKWEEDYKGIGDRSLSVIYFELKDVNQYDPNDWDKIYAFFVEKMPLLEEAYWEYRDLINEQIKSISSKQPY